MSLCHLREEHNRLVQFKPARAKVSVKFDDLTPDHVKDHVAEQKIDGQRFTIQTNRPTTDGKFKHGLTSRRESKITRLFVEKTDRVPHLANAPHLPNRARLDSELAAPTDMVLVDLPGAYWDHLLNPTHPHMLWLKQKFQGALPVYPHVSETTSIMGSSADEAVKKQQERGNVWAWVFDITAVADKDITGNAYHLRRGLLARSLERVDPETGIILMPAFDLPFKGVQGLYERLVGARGEGIVLKHKNLRYDHAKHWIKVKKLFTADVVLTGEFEYGEEGVTGKMLGLAGTLEVGVFVHGVLVPIGWISAIMNGEAKLPEITALAESGQLAGKVVEVAYNDLQKDPDSVCGYTLRHPRYKPHSNDSKFEVRWRDDKNPEDCTLEALLELFNDQSK